MEVDFSFLEFVKRGRATLPVVRLFAASAAALRVVHLRRMNTVSKASPNTSPFGTWLQHMMGHTGPQREDQSESFALPMTRIVSEEFSGVALRTLRDAIATVRDYSEEVGPSVAIILSKDLRLLALFQHAVTSNRTTATQIERFLTLHIYDFILALPMCILGTWQGFYQYRAFTETEMDPMMTFSIRSCEKWNVPHPDAVQSYLIRGGGEDGVGPYTMVGDVASGGTVRVEKRYRRHMWLYEGVILPCGIAGVWGSPGGAAQGTFVWWKGCEQDSRSMSVNV
ncbi:hypothetical protein M427DRAFT_341537 [Gonapodya prolifera JEL478]|uniref:Uncharacterized protein n=1 Tax=Gonapodya prolifera (strain JEL478) TaxID=1344416 RepID=A0A139ADC6_GONPJ|nr:hypothetical protein M427DRAFT_341537 [Gonapodya prolifera JEL478]|eukprot:KXS14423.1 hypothetical protein M427DRAFT_341537 [Gonapodya prolifera JEL478]